ncbi:MAG: PilZ domain-containing protein [Chromatiales bacterium]|nr:PilZ domain-containing protein [Chromatiales bacterium]
MSETIAQERRRSFRVDDDVHLVFRVIKEDSEPRQHGEDQTVQTCRALMQLRELSSQSGHILANIRKQHSDIAQYLALLDKKIEAVAQIAGAMSMGGDMAPNIRVNIGVGGLAFSQDSPLLTGQRLAMRIVLFPSHLCIQPKGRVVYSREQTQADQQHRHRIGVEFEPLSEQEQDQLIRHLLEKQSAQRRRERGMDVD